MEKDVLSVEKDHHSKQAFEVVHHFYCSERFLDSEGSFGRYMKEIRSFGEEFFHVHGQRVQRTLVDLAIAAAEKWMMGRDMEKKTMISNGRWDDIIKYHEADRNLIHKTCIYPALDRAVGMLNHIAGCDAIPLGINPSYCITQFVTDSMKGCLKSEKAHWQYDVPCKFLNYMKDGPNPYNNLLDYDYGDSDLLWEYSGSDEFPHGLYVCMVLERKIAQYHFHKKSKPVQPFRYGICSLVDITNMHLFLRQTHQTMSFPMVRFYHTSKKKTWISYQLGWMM